MALQGVQPALRLARMSDREAIEALMRRSLAEREGGAPSVALLSSDVGKLYVALAQALERIKS